MFKNINKSPARIPTRLLLESGLGLIQTDQLQGNITPSNQVDFQAFNALHYSLDMANVDKLKQFPSYEDIQSQIVQYPQVQIQLPILRIKYNTLNPMGAEYQWFLIKNQQLYDTPKGLKANPFNTGEAFAIAPTQEETKDGTAEFIFRKELFVNNTGLDVKQIEADFDDGNGKNTYNFDDPINITWASGGTKDLKYFITFSDGSKMEGHSAFKVTVPATIVNGKYTLGVQDATVVGVGYTLQIGFSDKNKANNPAVLPANLKIRKPFIILDGIDQLNKYDYKSFMFSTGGYGISPNMLFQDSLAAAGYDLVYFDYADGGASILVNAGFFKTAINYINAQKALVLYLINNCIILNSCIYCVTLPYEKSQNSSK